LAEASDFARGVLESIQALAGTTSCKGVQIARLKDWAITNHCWLDKDKLGFHKELDGGYFTSGDFDIFDAVPNNVLMGDDGHLYFIDTIIFKSGTGGFDTYQSLSPRARKRHS
jgi:hypothetical protein